MDAYRRIRALQQHSCGLLHTPGVVGLRSRADRPASPHLRLRCDVAERFIELGAHESRTQ